MKLFKSILLIAACHAAQASAVVILTLTQNLQEPRRLPVF